MHAATLDSFGNYDPTVLDAAVATEYDILDAAGFFDTIANAFNKVKEKIKKGWDTAKKYVAAGLDSPIGQMVMNYAGSIPGYGTAIGAGLGALNAAAHGKDWTAIAAEAAKKALPGGFAKDLIVDAAQGALSAAVTGKGVKGAIAGAVGGAAKAGIARLLPKSVPPTIANLVSGAAGQIPSVLAGGIGMGSNHQKLLSAAHTKAKAKNVAASLLQDPNLRALGTAQLAKALGTTKEQAITGQRALFRLAGVASRPFPGFSLDAGAMIAGEPAPPGTGFSRVRFAGRRARAIPFDGGELAVMARRMPHLRRAPQFHRLLTALPSREVNDAGAIDPANPRIWIVTSGDTLSKIAAALGHPTEAMVLYSVNKSPVGPLTDPSKLYPNQKLKIPDSWVPNLPSAPPSVPGVPSSPLPSGMQLHHIVQPGETLSSIADDFGHPGEWSKLYAENKAPAGPLTDPDEIQVGMLLKVPDGWAPPSLPPAIPTPTPGPVPPTPTPVPAPDAKIVAEAQARLAYWNAATKKCVPADYGLPSDFTGTINARFTSAVKSFQLWSNQTMGTSLRTDGALDEPTHAQLSYVSGGLMGKGVPVPPQIPGAPPPSPVPAPPYPVPVPEPVPPPPVPPSQNHGPPPPWYVPGTDPALYKMPDGSWETYPGQAKGMPMPPGWPGGELPPGPMPWPGPPPPDPPKKKGGGLAAVGILTVLGVASAFK